MAYEFDPMISGLAVDAYGRPIEPGSYPQQSLQPPWMDPVSQGYAQQYFGYPEQAAYNQEVLRRRQLAGIGMTAVPGLVESGLGVFRTPLERQQYEELQELRGQGPIRREMPPGMFRGAREFSQQLQAGLAARGDTSAASQVRERREASGQMADLFREGSRLAEQERQHKEQMKIDRRRELEEADAQFRKRRRESAVGALQTGLMAATAALKTGKPLSAEAAAQKSAGKARGLEEKAEKLSTKQLEAQMTAAQRQGGSVEDLSSLRAGAGYGRRAARARSRAQRISPTHPDDELMENFNPYTSK